MDFPQIAFRKACIDISVFPRAISHICIMHRCCILGMLCVFPPLAMWFAQTIQITLSRYFYEKWFLFNFLKVKIDSVCLKIIREK